MSQKLQPIIFSKGDKSKKKDCKLELELSGPMLALFQQARDVSQPFPAATYVDTAQPAAQAQTAVPQTLALDNSNEKQADALSASVASDATASGSASATAASLESTSASMEIDDAQDNNSDSDGSDEGVSPTTPADSATSAALDALEQATTAAVATAEATSAPGADSLTSNANADAATPQTPEGQSKSHVYIVLVRPEDYDLSSPEKATSTVDGLRLELKELKNRYFHHVPSSSLTVTANKATCVMEFQAQDANNEKGVTGKNPNMYRPCVPLLLIAREGTTQEEARTLVMYPKSAFYITTKPFHKGGLKHLSAGAELANVDLAINSCFSISTQHMECRFAKEGSGAKQKKRTTKASSSHASGSATFSSREKSQRIKKEVPQPKRLSAAQAVNSDDMEDDEMTDSEQGFKSAAAAASAGSPPKQKKSTRKRQRDVDEAVDAAAALISNGDREAAGSSKKRARKGAQKDTDSAASVLMDLFSFSQSSQNDNVDEEWDEEEIIMEGEEPDQDGDHKMEDRESQPKSVESKKPGKYKVIPVRIDIQVKELKTKKKDQSRPNGVIQQAQTSAQQAAVTKTDDSQEFTQEQDDYDRLTVTPTINKMPVGVFSLSQPMSPGVQVAAYVEDNVAAPFASQDMSYDQPERPESPQQSFSQAFERDESYGIQSGENTPGVTKLQEQAIFGVSSPKPR